jgi:CRP/FNR family transcriptional regulator, cyclic AMP receptor protein
MSHADDIKLSGYAVLNDLPPDAQIEVAARLERRGVASGERLIGQGEAATAMYFVARGEFSLFRSLPGAEEGLTAMAGPGDLLGELSILAGKETSDVGVRAETAGEVLALSLDAYRELSAQLPALRAAMLRHAAERALDFGRRIAELQTLDVARRTGAALLKLARERGLETPAGMLISPSPTQEAIARMIGASREAVTRELGGLAKRGVIELRRGAILVVDARALGG